VGRWKIESGNQKKKAAAPKLLEVGKRKKKKKKGFWGGGTQAIPGDGEIGQKRKLDGPKEKSKLGEIQKGGGGVPGPRT